MECGRKLLNALPDIGEGEEEGTDEYWVSGLCNVYESTLNFIHCLLVP